METSQFTRFSDDHGDCGLIMCCYWGSGSFSPDWGPARDNEALVQPKGILQVQVNFLLKNFSTIEEKNCKDFPSYNYKNLIAA